MLPSPAYEPGGCSEFTWVQGLKTWARFLYLLFKKQADIRSTELCGDIWQKKLGFSLCWNLQSKEQMNFRLVLSGFVYLNLTSRERGVSGIISAHRCPIRKGSRGTSCHLQPQARLHEDACPAQSNSAGSRAGKWVMTMTHRMDDCQQIVTRARRIWRTINIIRACHNVCLG